MPRPLPPEKIRARAVALYTKGMNLRAVAEAVGVSAPTIKRWVDAAGKSRKKGPPPAAEPAPVHPSLGPLPTAGASNAFIAPEAPADDEPIDALEVAQKHLRRAARAVDTAAEAGHHEAAASFLRQVGTIIPVLARLQAAAKTDDSLMHISRTSIDEAIASAMTKLKALNDRGGLRCCDCDRKLSISFGGYDSAVIDDRLKNGH